MSEKYLTSLRKREVTVCLLEVEIDMGWGQGGQLPGKLPTLLLGSVQRAI